jgi:hypothetical protein
MAKPTAPEQIDADLTALRSSAEILDGLGAPAWGAILRDIADAAETAYRGPVSLAERMRWTPTVVHATHLARALLAASGTPTPAAEGGR